ncbi:uncharacterized protein PADG_12053 [Paracoccidioides brasiliensis Pb18]|uniref:Uncharacterized protein n=2 Tax=Paracoccidioides brasiliensis TaxID=121759 RepID=A0A0A0HTZ3_PARBD|nr:uncharacterized protein PADG_12053 [Paracoccidioides brasiliensis Pb18]KGM91748.1 hypothetical protein PADG_12053 [Paracoccidioides brasiliensis Pb18]ODH36477.1 hypothetical protein ACO22_02759 [Paracoccidioides brasiliensis]
MQQMRAALLDPHYVKTWVKRGDVEMKRDKANTAHSSYQKAIEFLDFQEIQAEASITRKAWSSEDLS